MDRPKKSFSMARLEQILPAAFNSYQLLVPAMQSMLHHRFETLSQLNQIADELDKRQRQVNIAKLVGGGVGVIGSATAAAGVALTPFTAGAASFLIGGGIATASVGVSTALGSHIGKKVLEKVDLEEAQQIVDGDRRQCEEVKKLWKEFDSYCVDAVNTIALADPEEESDIASLQTRVQVALKEVVEPIILIAETFCHLETGSFSNCTGQQLVRALYEKAQTFLSHQLVNKFVSSGVSKLKTGLGTAAFLMIATLGVGSLLVVIITAIDIHKGSLSKVAKDIREKFRLLQQELDKWLDAFG